MNKSSIQLPVVEITSLPKYSYFEWFILGFYELESKGIIRLKINVDFYNQVSRFTDNKYILYAARKIFYQPSSYTLQGLIKYKGLVKKFCIDCADSPFVYSVNDLESCDCYFKIQCPLSFDKNGFPLTEKINIPFKDTLPTQETKRDDESISNIIISFSKKIKPLMVGPRLLSRSISYRSLRSGYENYIKGRFSERNKKVMCYFGNSKGPEPSINIFEPDLNKESDLLGFYGSQINHPNEKRKLASDMINSLGVLYSGTIINNSFSDTKESVTCPELVVPLNDFCSYVSAFEYNLNISGYRRSIPNRFIESFIVGTAIVTDALKVKWYQPFGCEVFETVEMGYEPMSNVNWSQFKNDLLNLPQVNRAEVINEFERKWKPEVVANYLLNTVIDS